MRSSRTIATYIALAALLCWPMLARADILDEDTEPTVAPLPQQTDAPKPKDVPKTPGKTSTKGGDLKSDPADAPQSKSSKPRPGQAVLRPKNPGKKVATKKDREPVHFESKGLKGLREKGTVELVENVVVTQGTFRMEADHAQVYFDEAAKDVNKVIAEGNVKIFNLDENTGEKLKAYGNTVLFLNKDRVVILEGNARLWRGEDSMIRGKKITYEMDTGWIKADQVAGELTPSEKDKLEKEKK